MIQNLTPHAVNYIADTGDHAFPSTGIARLATKVSSGTLYMDLPLEAVKITRTEYGAVENLPAFESGKYYIVSAMVRTALPERSDLLSPSGLVRDDKGNIIGCRSFDTN